MAIQDILEKIKNDALDESKKLAAQNTLKAESISGDAEKEVEKIVKEAKELAEKKYASEKRLKISLATLELKNKLLAVKQGIIDKAFEKALEEIKALPVEKYTELLIGAILKGELRGDEEVILGVDDFNRLGEGFVDKMNAAFAKSGKKAGFKLIDEKRENISGCILKDGRKETICSFESIVAGKRKELEKEIASILFKE